MRILMTVDPEIPVPPGTYGGIERVADALVKAFLMRGHEIGLVAHPAFGMQRERVFSVVRLSVAKRHRCLAQYAGIAEAVAVFQPDVLHSFSRILYMFPLARNSLPKIMCFQREPTPRTVFLGAMLFNGSLSFTGISDYICRQGRRAGGDWRSVQFRGYRHLRVRARGGARCTTRVLEQGRARKRGPYSDYRCSANRTAIDHCRKPCELRPGVRLLDQRNRAESWRRNRIRWARR
jgi:hypothetical protein